MDTPTFAWRLFELLSPVALAGTTWLAVKAAQLLSERTRTEQLMRVLLLLDDVVPAAVREAQQVLVDRLKAASRDGQLTPEQRAEVKQTALDSVKSQLGTQGLAQIAQVFGLDDDAIERLLATRLEAAVHRLKTSARVAASPGTAGDAVPFAA